MTVGLNFLPIFSTQLTTHLKTYLKIFRLGTSFSLEIDMKFICVREYKAKLPDELTIELGDVVDIIKRHHDGWWEVRFV